MKRLAFFAGVLLFFVVVSFFSFRLPDQTIVVSGDFYQLPNYTELSSRYEFAWFNQIGQGSYNPLFLAFPFYWVLGVINSVLPTHWIASWILFLFLSGAFFSFWTAIRWLIPGISDVKRGFVSLVYSLNTFVITIFTYGWGFTHHFLFYVFLPILVISYLAIIREKKFSAKSFIFFAVSFVLSLPSYNNLAFFVLLLLLELVFTVAFLFTKTISLSKGLFVKFFAVGALYLVLVWPFMYPMIDSSINGANKLFHSQAALGGENYLDGWITSTSNTFRNIFSLALDNYRYPFSESTYALPFLAAGTVYFLLLAYLLYVSLNDKKEQTDQQRLIVSALGVFSVFAVLALRFTEPFKILLQPIYLSPFFIFFRSPEKIFIAIPFVFTVLVALLIQKVSTRKMKFMLVLVLGSMALPFLSQVIQKSLMNDYNQFAKKKVPEYSYIVSIPDPYVALRDVVNADQKSTALISLPYSVKNSINWSNYPMWHYVGHDVLHALYNKRYISANTYDHTLLEGRATFQELNKESATSQDLLDAIQKFGGQYVMFHKDVDQSLLLKSEHLQTLVDQLVQQNTLSQKADTENFTFYQVADEFVTPVLSVDKGTLTYAKRSPVLYDLQITSTDATTLKFLQSLDLNWKLYVVNDTPFPSCLANYTFLDGRVQECVTSQRFFVPEILQTLLAKPLAVRHSVCKDYANCWEFSPSDLNASGTHVLLYYTHQNVVYGQLISVSLVLLLCGGLFTWGRFYKKMETK